MMLTWLNFIFSIYSWQHSAWRNWQAAKNPKWGRRRKIKALIDINFINKLLLITGYNRILNAGRGHYSWQKSNLIFLYYVHFPFHNGKYFNFLADYIPCFSHVLSSLCFLLLTSDHLIFRILSKINSPPLRFEW